MHIFKLRTTHPDFTHLVGEITEEQFNELANQFDKLFGFGEYVQHPRPYRNPDWVEGDPIPEYSYRWKHLTYLTRLKKSEICPQCNDTMYDATCMRCI